MTPQFISFYLARLSSHLPPPFPFFSVFFFALLRPLPFPACRLLVALARLIFSFSSLCSLAVKLKRGAQNLLSEGKWESGGKCSSGSSRGSTVDWAYAQYFIGRREKVTPAATAADGIKNCVMPTMHRVALAQVGVLQQGRE